MIDKLKVLLKDPIIFFFIKAVFLWLLWITVYGFIFKENQINDPITKVEAKLCAFIFEQFGFEVSIQSDKHVISYYDISGNLKTYNDRQYIYLNNVPVIAIAAACNGLELFSMFVGFILAFGGKKKLFPFLMFGLISLFLFNLIRIIIIALISLNNKFLTFFICASN